MGDSVPIPLSSYEKKNALHGKKTASVASLPRFCLIITRKTGLLRMADAAIVMLILP